MAVDGVCGAGLSGQAVASAVGTARVVVAWLVGGLTGFTVDSTAERNAWEATCADLQRRTSGEL
ncbi:hypothetical protein [Actinopolymorpha pittospori]|uniref:Uncharacterized protein n=1 Tax=Actinopolymorpha pittospori TaxID=648752 RepID=A0A927MPU3_9ACTN|nr:hypothetical protein [Actinopolymorpha pittospori]MBE1603869.1 hypothetical protein [Actinopolymorpha pittospori]